MNLVESAPALREGSGNVRVLRNLLGPAFRGIILQRGKQGSTTTVDVSSPAIFDWNYDRDQPSLAKLYESAKAGQWNATTDLDWSIDVDPLNPEFELLPEDYVPLSDYPMYRRLSNKEKAEHRHAIMSWLLSQFLHGEQGALFAASQVVQAAPWMAAKLYGSTQVVDEGRHVEVFSRYLEEKIHKRYAIDDNLYVIIDQLMGDSRWDMKFLGMQIMIEGLALGAFGTLRQATQEPLLKKLLEYVIGDEARHVKFGVVALREHYAQTAVLSDAERREREDWVFELSLLMRNRFLVHEYYEEYWAHAMSRREWNRLVLDSKLMELFRRTMFRTIIPNVKRIGLLSDRVRPRYAELGLLKYESRQDATTMILTNWLETVTI